jgi:hypothetical protein
MTNAERGAVTTPEPTTGRVRWMVNLGLALAEIGLIELPFVVEIVLRGGTVRGVPVDAAGQVLTALSLAILVFFVALVPLIVYLVAVELTLARARHRRAIAIVAGSVAAVGWLVAAQAGGVVPLASLASRPFNLALVAAIGGVYGAIVRLRPVPLRAGDIPER